MLKHIEHHDNCGCELDKSLVRDRFARAGHNAKRSSVYAIDEIRESISQYIKTANIVIANAFLASISESESPHFSMKSIIEEEDDVLLKGFFGRLKRVASSVLSRWLKLKPKPIHFPAADKHNIDWESVDDVLFYYMHDNMSPAAIEMLAEAAKAGVVFAEMQSKGETINQDMTYDKMRESAKELQKKNPKLSSEMAMAAEWARNHGADHIAVYNEKGERAGIQYERMRNLFREHIQRSLEAGEDASKMRSRLIFPVKWADVEGHQQQLSKELTESELHQYTVAHMNRDWDRLAYTETQFAVNNGKLLKWSSYRAPTYVSFTSMGSGKKKPCSFCDAHEGEVARVVSSQDELQNLPGYQGDDIIDDGFAKVAVWPGKNNVGRNAASFWLAAPAHPWCVHEWMLVK